MEKDPIRSSFLFFLKKDNETNLSKQRGGGREYEEMD